MSRTRLLDDSHRLTAGGLSLSIGLAFDFVAVLSLFVFSLLPYFLTAYRFFPTHDTQFSYQIFFNFYNEMFQFGAVPLWRPFDSFGLTSDLYHLFSISFAQYSVALFGWLLSIEDVFTLYRVSIGIESFAFVIGFYLLAKRFLKNPLSLMFACTGAIASIFWERQIWWNFRIFYLLPLIVFFVLKSFDEKKLNFIWMAAFTYFISQWGNIPYYIPVHAIFVGGIGLAFYFKERPRFILQKSDLLCLIFCLAGAFLLFDFISNALVGLANHTPNREAGSLSIGLYEFLTYSKPAPGMRYLGEFFRAALTNEDCSSFIGLIPFPFLALGVLRVPFRSPFWVFLGVASVVALLSLACYSFVAPLFFYVVPLMGKIRHLPYLMVITKVALFLSAAIAFESYLDEPNERDQSWLGFMSVGLGLTIIFSHLISPQGAFLFSRGMVPADFILLPACLIICLGLRFFSSAYFGRRAASFSIYALYSIEILSFGSCFHFFSMFKSPDVPENSMIKIVRPYDYQDKRVWEGPPAEPRLDREYPIIGNTMYHDECAPSGRIDWLASGVSQLLSKRLRLSPGSELKDLLGPLIKKDDRLMVDLGCNRSKLAIVNSPTGATTTAGTRIDNSVVHVTHFSSNQIEIDAKVSATGPVWLTYSDAWHPGWKASVNGADAPIVKVQGAFKGVRLDSPSNHVRFDFRGSGRNRYYYPLLFVLSLAFCGLLLLLTVQAFYQGHSSLKPV